MIDWGISAIITALVAFGYTVWVENKVKKLNDRIAGYEKELERLSALVYTSASENANYKEKPLKVVRCGVPDGGDFVGGVVDE